MIDDIDAIDKESESVGLSFKKFLLRKYLDSKLQNILREEEVKWFQRAKEQDLLMGDSLTSYFMAKVNARRRRNRIVSLKRGGGID